MVTAQKPKGVLRIFIDVKSLSKANNNLFCKGNTHTSIANTIVSSQRNVLSRNIGVFDHESGQKT